MKQISDSKPSVLWDKVLCLSPKDLAAQARRAAIECQTALSLLTGRRGITPDVLNRLQEESNEMLRGIGLVIGRLSFTDKQAKDLTARPALQRYLRILKTLESGTASLSPSQRQTLEAERDALANEASGDIAGLGSLLRSGLLLRLEVIRYWKALLYKAIEVYSTFKDFLRNSLHSITDQITNSVLRKIVMAVVSRDDIFRMESFEAKKCEFSSDLGDVDRQALRELEELSAVESQLQTIRGTAVELEETHSRVRYEIRRTEKRDTPPKEWTEFKHSLDRDEEPSEQPQGDSESRASVILKRAEQE